MYCIYYIGKGALLGGSGGSRAPLLFYLPRGIHTLEKNCTCFFIFPEIPRLVHPCYLGWISLGTYYLHAGAGIT